MKSMISRKSLSLVAFTTSILSASIIGSTSSSAQASVSLNGIFTSTDPVCTDTDVCNGLGTSQFNYGQPVRTPFNNELSFSGNTIDNEQFSTAVFNAGTLTITNGSIAFGSFPTYRDNLDGTTFINLNVSADINGTSSKSGDFLIAYNSTSNIDPTLNSPKNADFVYFPYNPEYGGFYILEGSTREQAIANVGILAQDPPSTLVPKGFQVLSGQTNGFLGALPPGQIDSNGRYRPNSENFTPKPVPEPLTILGSLTAAGFGIVLKRKR
ncbi:MAG: PEP-CTERM sorting domain-containing protein [Gloeotrichia echinulata CP02]